MALPRVIFIMGAPGARKHYQMAMIVEKLGYFYLSTGDLIRAEMNNPEGDAENKRVLFEQGGMDNADVMAELACRLLAKMMDEIMETSKGAIRKFLVDGFPRDMHGVDCWNKQMQHRAQLEFVLFFDAWKKDNDEEQLVEHKKFKNPFKKQTINTSTNGLKLRLDGIMHNMHEVLLHYEAERKLKAFDLSPSRQPKDVFKKVRKVLK